LKKSVLRWEERLCGCCKSRNNQHKAMETKTWHCFIIDIVLAHENWHTSLRIRELFTESITEFLWCLKKNNFECLWQVPHVLSTNILAVYVLHLSLEYALSTLIWVSLASTSLAFAVRLFFWTFWKTERLIGSWRTTSVKNLPDRIAEIIWFELMVFIFWDDRIVVSDRRVLWFVPDVVGHQEIKYDWLIDCVIVWLNRSVFYEGRVFLWVWGSWLHLKRSSP